MTILNELQTNKLKQLLIEDQLSRRNILDIVKTVVIDAATSNMQFLYQSILSNLNIWAQDNKCSDKENLAIELIVAVVMEQNVVPIQSVIAKIAAHLKYDDDWKAVQAAAELLGSCKDTSLYQLIEPVDGESLMIKSNLTLDQDTQDHINHTRYLDPMLCKPKDWTGSYKGGYLTTKEHVVLGKGNNHHMNQALDALNLVQQIEWELDTWVLNFVEEPKEPFDTIQQQQAHEQLVHMSNHVYENMLKQGNKFYFTWKFDFRGRMYSQGYYINLQSTSYKKALLNFKKKELIQ